MWLSILNGVVKKISTFGMETLRLLIVALNRPASIGSVGILALFSFHMSLRLFLCSWLSGFFLKECVEFLTKVVLMRSISRGRGV